MGAVRLQVSKTVFLPRGGMEVVYFEGSSFPLLPRPPDIHSNCPPKAHSLLLKGLGPGELY